MHRRAALRGPLFARRHTALLIAIVAAFAVRPLIGDSRIAPLVFSLALLILLVVALYTIQVDELAGKRDVLVAQARRRRLMGGALAALAIFERLGTFFFPSPRLNRLGALSWMLFFAFVAWAQLRSVLKHKEVSGETISMSVSIYLLLGLTWGLLYVVIFQYHPDAFSFGSSAPPNWGDQNVFTVFVYFSLTTISTIGFGDITPVSLQARYAAVAEGITGQFYLAILVARLVGIQMSRSLARDDGGGD